MSVSKDAPAQSMNRVQRFFLNSRRILKIATKPTRKEFTGIMKVCLIGLLIIGVLSYVVQLISSLLQQSGTG